MIKIFAAFTIFTVMISTAAVYNLKQVTNGLEEKKRHIAAQILKDREAIKVLKAEMAYLSRPERLERLSRRHLVLESAQNQQLASDINDLSMRENIRMANLPIDNFQLLLPRQKPQPRAISKAQYTPATNLRLASLTDSKGNESNIQKLNAEKSLYERILAKLRK